MIPALADTLAVFRLTRLVVDDHITEGVRQRIWAKHPIDHGLGFAISCVYCSSIWASALVMLARQVAPKLWQPVAELLAMAAVAGEVAARLG